MNSPQRLGATCEACKGRIRLRRVRLYAHHGVMAQERRVGAWFELTMAVDYDMTEAMTSDDVGHALSYADLFDVVRSEMTVPSNLLEHVAARIVDATAHRFPQATAIDLELIKLNPPMGADCDGAGVNVTWQRPIT